MNEAVNIKKVESLVSLRHLIQSFVDIAIHELTQVKMKIQRSQELFSQKLAFDQRSLAAGIDNVRNARIALEDCEAQEDEDYIPDCSYEEQELRIAKLECLRAEKQLTETKQWLNRVDRQIEKYYYAAQKMNQLVDMVSVNSMVFLQKKIIEIEKYINLSQGNSQSTHAVNYSSNVNNITQSLSSTSTVANIASQSNTTPGNWVEKGIQSVDLSQLPEVEGINGPGDFQKESMENMEKGLKKLEIIRNVINQGAGTDSSYWAEVDKRKNLTYTNGYQKIYEAFYGDSHIRIVKDGNNYSISNGRHRVWLAKKMGIHSLPASVVEKQGG